MKTQHQYRVLAAICMIVFLNGCAARQRIRYSGVELGLTAAGKTAVAVSSQDARGYVTKGEKQATYVGTFRGGYGNPFNVNTESAKAVAADITDDICASLQTKGFTCTAVYAEANEAKVQVVDKLKARNAQRLILVTINELRSDTYQNTSLFYDLALAVMDTKGAVLAEAKAKGEDALGGNLLNPGAHAKRAVPAAFKKVMETLLNDPAVVAALK